jgi:hypothetical protein
VAVPLVNYWVHHESYLERCENKAKPELECDGCCQVKKEVAEAAHDDNITKNQTIPSSQRTQSTETLELFHLAVGLLELAAPQIETLLFGHSPDPSLLFGVGTVPFQPPRLQLKLFCQLW